MALLQKIEPAAALPEAITPMQMIASAIAGNHTTDTIEKLLDLEARWRSTQGRREFDSAIAAAKAQIPIIEKNRKGHNGKMYADFSAYAKTIDPILSEHGLSYRFRTKQENGTISVTCIISHKDGHSEESTLSGPEDKTGNKNAIQAIGSTVTYLQRYTLVLALGLAASEDDDGNRHGAPEKIGPREIELLQGLIAEAKADIVAVCNHYKVASLADMTVGDFNAAGRTLNQRIARMKAESGK